MNLSEFFDEIGGLYEDWLADGSNEGEITKLALEKSKEFISHNRPRC